MKINSFLKLIVLVPVVLGLLIGATQFWFIHQKEDLETLRTSANRISTGVFELALLTQEFTTLSSPDHPAFQRIQVQWLRKHAVINQALDQASFEDTSKDADQTLHNMLADLLRLFKELVLIVDVAPAASERTKLQLPVVRIAQLTNQLTARSQVLVSALTQIRQSSIDQLRKVARQSDLVILIMILTLVGLIAVLGALLSKTLLARLAKLEQGIAIIGSGELHYRLQLSGADELAVLGRAFDDMLDNLQHITASRDELHHEVAERERAEMELQRLNTELESRVQQRTAELTTANQELESFAYSVSHDLRAPLRHIQGYTQLLVEDIKEQLSDEPLRYLHVIEQTSTEMGQTIDDLLAFSRIGRTAMQQVDVPMDEIVQSSLQSLELVIQQRHIEWKISSLPPVRGDPTLLKHVLANLLGNAIKYTAPRNPATIEVGCDGPVDGMLTFFVRDNGVGFDMQYVHKLFGVFQRLHRADEFEGTGIGLAIVKRIITRHRGRVWAESALGQGATFYFTLPATA